MPFFRIVDCQTFFAEYFCHMVVLLNIILRNGKLPNGKIAEGCCGMTYSQLIACCRNETDNHKFNMSWFTMPELTKTVYNRQLLYFNSINRFFI